MFRLTFGAKQGPPQQSAHREWEVQGRAPERPPKKLSFVDLHCKQKTNAKPQRQSQRVIYGVCGESVEDWWKLYKDSHDLLCAL